MNHTVLATFLASTPLLAVPQPGARGCLRYEPDTVAVTGRLERRTFYGPPGYGEDPRRDARETGYYLVPASPLCAAGSPDPEINAPRSGVRLVQLVLDSAGYARLRPQLGRAVTVRGALFMAHTGHHHAPLVLYVAPPTR